MKNQINTRKTLVFIFKNLIHILTYLIFIKGFATHYLGLRFFSRTLAVTTMTFVALTAWFISVYGRVVIGEKKSSPLFHTLALNLLLTNILTFIVLRVMTFHDHFSILSDILMLIMVYIVQLIVGRFLIFSANSLYFRNYVPEKTIVIDCHSAHKDKVIHYLERHKKQYDVVEILESPSIDDVNLKGVENLFVLGESNGMLYDLLMKSAFSHMNIYYETNINHVWLNDQKYFVVDDVMLFHHKTNPITHSQHFMKRAIDIVFSLIGFVFAAPIMLIVAIMIKLDDGGPIFFSQERLTENERVFDIYKFRSMKMNSGDKPVRKDDDRITKSGHIIRKLRLDELPQLINILKGDMSIVGPRPESVVITNDIVEDLPEFKLRLRTKAGLTGTAQILGKYNTKPKDKLLFDLYYIENFSILNDLKLMFQTLIVFVKKDSTEGFDK